MTPSIGASAGCHPKLPVRSLFLFRTRAVERILLEDLAGLRNDGTPGGEASDAPDEDDSRDRLAAARRKAVLVIALDWAALLILLFARARSAEIFSFGPTEESIFAVGILAIAVHSGFRLGQLEKYDAIRRVLEELDMRSGRSGSPDTRK